MKNKFGLDRTISAQVKREIRKQCKFGCVVCGNAIIEYEHVDPEFHDAKVHDPSKMTLLCPQCHSKVTRGFMSKETVKRAMLNPKCSENGFTRETLDMSLNHPTIKYGKNGFTAINCMIPVQVNKTPLMKIIKPVNESEPYLLSCSFRDSNNFKSLEIIDNEFFIFNNNWDVTIEGKSITVREGLGDIHLKLTFVSPELILIEKLKMNYFGNTIIVDKNGFQSNTMSMKDVTIEGHIGIQLNLQLKKIELSKICIYHLKNISYNIDSKFLKSGS